MRTNVFFLPFTILVLSALTFNFAVTFSSKSRAEPITQNGHANQPLPMRNPGRSPRPGILKNKIRAIPILTIADRVAALESIQFGLSKIGDGSSYIWHRSHGRLSGVVRPTKSFKDNSGKICRHFEVIYVAGSRTRGLETVACRLDNGVWEISG